MRPVTPLRRMVLSMYDSLTFLTDVCHLEPRLARELIELVIYSQWVTARANGIEWVHGPRHAYTSIYETLDDFLEEKVAEDNLCIPRSELLHATHGVLSDMPCQHQYWEELNQHGSLTVSIDWRRHDVLVQFI